MTPAISLTGLMRTYRDHTALDGLNIAIGAGTITGLPGRSGAGKTTLQAFSPPPPGRLADRKDQRMSTWVTVARYNLMRRASYLVLTWLLSLAFAVGAVTAGRNPADGHEASGSEHWHFTHTPGQPSAGLTALGLTGVVAALAVLLLAGGQATIRRATI